MNGVPVAASAHLAYYREDPELAITLPVRPRLLVSHQALPYDSDGLIVVGGDDSPVIRGPGARLLLSALLPLLDGRRTVVEIAQRMPAALQGRVEETIAMLAHRGLIEDGDDTAHALAQTQPQHAALAHYVGRYVNVSRRHRSGGAALRSLAAQRLAVVAPDALADRLQPLLSDLPVAALVRIAPSADTLPADITVALHLQTEGAPAPAWLAPAVAAGIPVLHAALGPGAIQVGPLFVSGLSAGYACMQEALRRDAEQALPSDPVPADDWDFWLGYLCHELANLISGTSRSPLFNRCRLFRQRHGRLSSELVSITPLPGAAGSRLMAHAALDDEDAMQAWALHNRIRMPPKDLMGPSIYFGHYSLSNRQLAGVRPPRHHTGAQIDLPPPAVDAEGGGRVGGSLDAAALGTLLGLSYGTQWIQGTPRAMAPSAGGLRSAEAYLAVQQVEGLPPGLYRYNGDTHGLERLHAVAAQVLAACVGDRPDAGCWLLGVAAFERVATKYGEMAFKHTHLDAGVMQTLTAEVCDRLGLDYAVLPDPDALATMQLAGIPHAEGRYFLTHVMRLGKVPTSPWEEHPLHRLQTARRNGPAARQRVGMNALFTDAAPGLSASWMALLRSRRAVRRFAVQPPPDALVAGLIRAAESRLADDSALHASPRLTWWWLFPRGAAGQPAGLYRFTDAQGLRAVALIKQDDARRFSNQEALSEAPIMALLTADLAHGFQQRGGVAYREALQAAGRALMALWLDACAQGCVGTISGGVLDDGLQRHADTDGYADAALAMFVFGAPEATGAADAPAALEPGA